MKGWLRWRARRQGKNKEVVLRAGSGEKEETVNSEQLAVSGDVDERRKAMQSDLVRLLTNVIPPTKVMSVEWERPLCVHDLGRTHYYETDQRWAIQGGRSKRLMARIQGYGPGTEEFAALMALAPELRDAVRRLAFLVLAFADDADIKAAMKEYRRYESGTADPGKRTACNEGGNMLSDCGKAYGELRENGRLMTLLAECR